MIDLQNDEYKTLEDLRESCPSIFTEAPSLDVTEKYTHIPTDQIIRDMELLGWRVIGAEQVSARKDSTRGFQKHLVVFRNPDIVINELPDNIKIDKTSPTGYRNDKGQFVKGEGLEQIYPQILLTNSHDGKNCFIFTAGLFRMVCENGLVIATEEFENLKVRHMGYTFEVLQKEIREMVVKLPLTVETMNKMRNTELSEEAILEFAERAISTRFTPAELINIEIDPDDLTQPQRTADKGNDLWRTFNVVQERLLNGDFTYSNGVKERKARKVKNFKQDMQINSDLFELALEYCN